MYSINKRNSFGNTVGGVPLNMFVVLIFHLVFPARVVTVTSSYAETFFFPGH